MSEPTQHSEEHSHLRAGRFSSWEGEAEALAQADLLLPQAPPSGVSDSAFENLTSFLRSYIIPP